MTDETKYKATEHYNISWTEPKGITHSMTEKQAEKFWVLMEEDTRRRVSAYMWKEWGLPMLIIVAGFPLALLLGQIIGGGPR
jgi:hypothetical protein